MKNHFLAKILLAVAVMLTAGGFLAKAQKAWPEDPEAFDYGVAAGVTKTANIAADAFGVAAKERLAVPSTVVDNITWLSAEKNAGTHMGNRIVYNRVKAYEQVAGTKVASDVGIRFKINRPGTFDMYPRFMYAEAERAQKFIAVLVTTKGGVTTATKIFEQTKAPEDMSTSGKEQSDPRFRVKFEVTAEMLSGIDGAATVYFWHKADNEGNIGHMVSYFPPKWTPSL
ncbi:MAG: hypothetical protein J5771_05055 [Bacteroidales bacterium]|nr:hypothetical protein [Bacteroidales bacterium]